MFSKSISSNTLKSKITPVNNVRAKRISTRTLSLNDLHQKRKELNTLFYSCTPLTGNELRDLVKSRRLQFSAVENGIELFIHIEKWDKDDMITWVGMSDILNTWSAGDQVRSSSKNIKENELAIIPIFIPATLMYDDDEYHHIVDTYSF